MSGRKEKHVNKIKRKRYQKRNREKGNIFLKQKEA